MKIAIPAEVRRTGRSPPPHKGRGLFPEPIAIRSAVAGTLEPEQNRQNRTGITEQEQQGPDEPGRGWRGRRKNLSKKTGKGLAKGR